MSNKIMRLSKYLISLLFVVIYGIILYFVFTWLIGYSPLYAYLGNLALIIIMLAADEYMLKIIQSEKFIMRIKKEKDLEKSYRSLKMSLSNISSFKTELYLFYVFISVISQIIEFKPDLLNENIVNFIMANNYSILILLAFDTLIKQFTNDRERMGKIIEKLKKHLTENQE